MTDLPKKRFSNARGLPLGASGRVDFSLEVKSPEDRSLRCDPTKAEKFMGRMFDQISMSDGGRIIRLYQWDEQGQGLPLKIVNFNIFRLDSLSQIIWQIKRVEIVGQVNWNAVNQQAKEEDPNCEEYFDPFIRIGYKFFERHPVPYKGPSHPTVDILMFDNYAPGRLLGAATNWWGYDIDPETGIAACNGHRVK